MKIYTTLNKIRAHKPCKEGYEILLSSLGKTAPDDEPVAFSSIISSNGVEDAIWCLSTICPEHAREVRLFAADCAERVLHIFEQKYPDDARPREAIKAARDYSNGLITKEALAAAKDAAWDAIWDARNAALAAAENAAGAASRNAAWAAWAAWDAAWDATWDATWDAAWDATWDAAKDAARDSAWAAARNAAWAAARNAAWDARDARAAGAATEQEAQAKLLTERFS